MESLIAVLIDVCMIFFFVRMFVAESERLHPVFGMVFRVTDYVIGPLQALIPGRRATLPCGLVIVALLLLQGFVLGSIPGAVHSFASRLLTVYVLIIIIIAGFREHYTNPFTSFGQRVVNPIRAIAANFSRRLVMVNILSIVILVLLHSFVTLALAALEGGGLPSIKAAIVGSPPDFGSLGLIVGLTGWFIFFIFVNAMLSWVSPDPSNPIVQLLALISAPIVDPIRRYMPQLPIDISPLIAIFALYIIKDVGYSLLSALQ